MNTTTFAKILKLEENVQSHKVMAAMGTFPWDRERAAEALNRLRPELFAAISALTPEEMTAYGEYRLTH